MVPVADVLISVLILVLDGVTLDISNLSAVLLAIEVTLTFLAISLVTAGGSNKYELS